MSIRVQSVTRRFKRQTVLDAVSLEVRDGDCYGFIGHNGAGKTTTMRVLLGLDRRYSGRVLVDGFDIREHPREARARMGGLIEVPGFHRKLDGARNLEMLARLQGLGRREARAEAGHWLEVVGLSHAGAKPEHAYSHGMRQRLGIAQALIGRPAYVLLDEPTNGLDPEGIAEMREVLRRLTRDEGMTVLLSSHQLAQLAEVCTRVGILRQGVMLLEQDTADLMRETRGRVRVEPAQPEDLEAIVSASRELGLEASADGGRVELELGARPGHEILKALVDRGLQLAGFAPEPLSLEEIYLRTSDRGERLATPSERPAEPEAPTQARAPRAPMLRTARYETSRLFSRPALAVLLAAPAVVAVTRLLRESLAAQALQEQVERGELFSTTEVTAFEAVGRALQAGLPLTGLILAGLASQTLAGERARGTLRNVLLRPVRRHQAVLGKALAHAGTGLATYAFLAIAALAAGAAFFDFVGVSELLPNGERYDLIAASELWPKLATALAAPLLPLAAFAAVGLAAGALVHGGAAALGLALGLVLLFDLARAIARGWGLEGLLPTAYLPSPLGDTSYLQFFIDVAQGVSNSSFDYGATAWIVPLGWAVVGVAIAVTALTRSTVS